MADTPTPATGGWNSISTTSESEFLKSSWSSENTNVYGDFFQETSDGNLSMGPKVQKSGIEILTTLLGYIIPVALLIVIILSLHVFIRTREDSSFAENYQFLCPYLNYGIEDENKLCKTMTTIAKEYQTKNTDLQGNIVDALAEYIPIKISRNIIDASPEKRFILETFAKKIHPDEVMKQFDVVVKKAQYSNEKNITCNGINITGGSTVSTQCTVLWGEIGDDDANRKLGSARIEALRFTEILANTIDSHFLLMNPPTTLSVEQIEGSSPEIPAIFKTRVTIPIQLQYVPFEQKL
jgi:hypothetical protein